MSFEIGNFVFQPHWPTIFLVVFLLGTPLWIVYRPDLKFKKRFDKFLGLNKTNQIIFDVKKNRTHWLKIKSLIDPTSPESWRGAMKEVDRIFKEIFQKLEPNFKDEKQCLEFLCQKDGNWLNVRPAMEIKNKVLNGQLNQVSQEQVDLALEKFEKILFLLVSID